MSATPPLEAPRRWSRLRAAAPILALWAAAALALSLITGRVSDWFVMTDELLYERFAISSARALTPLAQLRGKTVASLDQLYPLLIAPIYRSGLVPADLHRAHLLNAWLMSSACIPAYLLARRLCERRLYALLLALAVVCVPWIFYASFLLTEVVAYPAFLWALLGMQRTAAAPSRGNDALALGGLLLAIAARTQFVVLAAVLPVGILLLEAGPARASAPRLAALRDAVARHRLLAWVYLLAAAAAAVLAAFGRLHSALGTYGDTLTGRIPPGLATGLFDHLATLALGVGILPALLGAAWLGANVVARSAGRERRAFACLGAVTLVAVLVQVTVYDLRLGVGEIVYDRYLLYLAPVLLLGTLGAVTDTVGPRLSLLVAGALVALGFALNDPPAFEWQQFGTLSPDAPVSVLYRPLVRLAHGLGSARATLVELTLVLTALAAFLSWRVGTRALAVAAVAFALVLVPAETAYVVHRLFASPGWSGRPLTGGGAEAGLDWVDQAVGTHADVTMVPYLTSGDTLATEREWRDVEFWNKSVDRAVSYPDPAEYDYAGTSFPRIPIRIDPVTGYSRVSPTPWVLQSVYQSQLWIAGPHDTEQDGILLSDAGSRWRAAWVSFGLDDDGWTRPGVVARVRLFPAAGQRAPETRSLYLSLRAPGGAVLRAVTIGSNLGRYRGEAPAGRDLGVTVHVCVPARGYTDVTVAAAGASAIPGDLAGGAPSSTARRGGVALDEIDLVAAVGARCRPG